MPNKPGRRIGSIPWNKGKKTGHAPWRGKIRPSMHGNKFALGYKHSEEAKKVISDAMLGRKLSDETKAKIAEAMHKLGRPDHLKGPYNPRWTGNNRRSLKKIVFKRDKNKCVKCGNKAEELDHIIPIKIAPERFADFTNLQSLCKSCHREKTNSEITKS
jgi:hypothetical protein